MSQRNEHASRAGRFQCSRCGSWTTSGDFVPSFVCDQCWHPRSHLSRNSLLAENGKNAVNGARIVGRPKAPTTRAIACDDFPTGFQAMLSVLGASLKRSRIV
jgi:hypothetical protein